MDGSYSQNCLEYFNNSDINFDSQNSSSNCSFLITNEHSHLDGIQNISQLLANKTFQVDADSDLITFQEQSRFWVQRILVPLIMSIGVVGNTITIIIMTQRRMRSSTNCYLAALAIFDMSYLVFSFLLSLQHYPNIHAMDYYLYWKVWPYILTLTDASSNSSVWITVTFTVERYIAVSHPIKGKVICTESRAQKMIFSIFLMCLFITLPTSFEWKIVEIVDHDRNATTVRAEYSELGENDLYVSVYYWFVSVMFIIVPVILLAVFNAFLIRSVHSSKSRRKTMTRRKETGDQARQESKITVMLIAVVILFLMCQLPTAVILLYRSFHHVEPGTNEDLLLRGLGNIFNFLMAVNAAGNFVLYCLLSQKYRRTFLQIFCPCLVDKLISLHSVYQTTAYSTMDYESPGSKRKHSVRPTERNLLSGFKGKPGVRTVSFVSDSKDISATTRDPDLEFPNTAAVFNSTQINQLPPVKNSKRVLRGFRCPWKKQKDLADLDTQENTHQKLLSLKDYSLKPTEHDHKNSNAI